MMELEKLSRGCGRRRKVQHASGRRVARGQRALISTSISKCLGPSSFSYASHAVHRGAFWRYGEVGSQSQHKMCPYREVTCCHVRCRPALPRCRSAQLEPGSTSPPPLSFSPSSPPPAPPMLLSARPLFRQLSSCGLDTNEEGDRSLLGAKSTNVSSSTTTLRWRLPYTLHFHGRRRRGVIASAKWIFSGDACDR